MEPQSGASSGIGERAACGVPAIACEVAREMAGEGGPVPPTGKAIEADYVYVMQFEGDRISHMTKIWNDGVSMTQAGWA